VRRRRLRPSEDAFVWLLPTAGPRNRREPRLNIENPIDVGISKEEKHERLSILAQAVKILKDLGVEYGDPEAIEVLSVRKD
jgi:hypothetical protein